ncbi:MAG: hypothetical protein WA840_03530 [Caulobacteraceae bacterium]
MSKLAEVVVSVLGAAMVHDPRENIWPLAVWGYANAVGPWAYMASKDRESTGSTIALFAAQLGCVAMMVAVLFLGVVPEVVSLAPYLLPFLALGAVVQGLFAIAAAIEAGAKNARDAAFAAAFSSSR